MRTSSEAARPPGGHPWQADPTAQSLLAGAIPARVAWVAPDGGPRVAPLWYVWNGVDFVLATFSGAAKLSGLTAGARVALTVDTEDFPYRSLAVRGHVAEVRPCPGLVPEYVAAARRVLGSERVEAWVAHLQGRAQVRIAVRPERVTVSDLVRDSPFVARLTRQTGHHDAPRHAP